MKRHCKHCRTEIKFYEEDGEWVDDLWANEGTFDGWSHCNRGGQIKDGRWPVRHEPSESFHVEQILAKYE